MNSSRGNVSIVIAALAIVCGSGGACSTDDVRDEPQVVAMIGHEYQIVGEVYAYGVKAKLPADEASFVELIPLEITGPEVAFRARLPKGQTFRIASARRDVQLFGRSVEYLLELQNSDLPSGIEIRLGLTRGNEHGAADLNPQLYQRIR